MRGMGESRPGNGPTALPSLLYAAYATRPPPAPRKQLRRRKMGPGVGSSSADATPLALPPLDRRKCGQPSLRFCARLRRQPRGPACHAASHIRGARFCRGARHAAQSAPGKTAIMDRLNAHPARSPHPAAPWLRPCPALGCRTACAARDRRALPANNANGEWCAMSRTEVSLLQGARIRRNILGSSE